MKIIDNKGRIFGKINIIDFLFILFVIGMVFVLFLGYKILSSMAPRDIYASMEIRLKASNVDPSVTQVMKMNDVETSVGGRVVGRIVEIQSTKDSEIINISNNKIEIIKNPFKNDIVLLIDAKCKRTPDGLVYKNSPAKIGASIVFSTDLYTLTGLIVDMKPLGTPAPKDRIKEFE